MEAVTTGEKGILVAGVVYNVYSSIEKGEFLQIYYPESGTVINPRPAMILNTSSNVNDAKALLKGNYAIGVLLVFVKTLSEYGTSATLDRKIGF